MTQTGPFAGAEGAPQARWHRRRWRGWPITLAVVLAVPALLMASHSVIGRTSLASPYSVSVAVTLHPYDPQLWSLVNAADFESARAIDGELPDPTALPAIGEASLVAAPALPSSLGQEAYVGPAAQRYIFRGATSTDTARAHYCLTAALYYEAASESDDGMRGVAQVVLNRVRHPSFPASICGVVFQGSQRPIVCQFTFACDGAMARAPSRANWARAGRIAAEALAGRTFPAVGLATHYHTLAVRPSWSSSLAMTNVVGAHIFHRWRGRWGTPAAFSRPYAGREPVPGPYLPIAEQLAARAGRNLPALTPLPASVMAAPADPSALAAIGAATAGTVVPSVSGPQPGFSDPALAATGSPRPSPTYADSRLNGSGTVRDEYRDSGSIISR